MIKRSKFSLIVVITVFFFSPLLAEASGSEVLKGSEELEANMLDESSSIIEQVIDEEDTDGLEVNEEFTEETDVSKINPEESQDEVITEEQEQEQQEQEEVESETETEPEGQDELSTELENNISDERNNDIPMDETDVEEELVDENELDESEEVIEEHEIQSLALEKELEKGVRDPRVKQLKKDLAKLGFTVPGNTTTFYGKSTERKVKEFQNYYSVKDRSGVAGVKTLAKIQEVLASPLQVGKRNAATKVLKQKLNSIGLIVPGKTTTYYGAQTKQKISEFQKKYGLIVNGIADVNTLNKLEQLHKEASLDGTMYQGLYRADVITLKKNLAKLGFRVPGNTTNYYGAKTVEKVKKFQQHYKVNDKLGVTGKATQAKINELLTTPFQNGKRSKETIKLKADLKKLGFIVPGKGTSLYGKETTKQVKAFQKYYGLPGNGIADKPTLEKIFRILSTPLQKGKRHANTIQLKKDLNVVGFKVSNKPTRLYGATTTKQVKAFQKKSGLKAHGIADEKTLSYLAAAVKKENEKPKDIKIFLDPGHGGKDSGAVGYGLAEKNIALDIALHTAYALNSNYAGIQVKLSRTTDKFIGLEERAKMANEWEADYFVSIHNNSFNGAANGFESFIHNGKVSKDTKEKQEKIHDSLSKELGVKDRGKKSANFSVLRNTNMPAILLEYLFIDNKKENDQLKKKSYRKKLGQKTAEALAKAFKLKKK